MRTTVTLDDDVQRMLKDASHRSGIPFKQVLNDAVRNGLRARAAAVLPFQQPVFALGRARVDLTKAGALAAELEDQHTAAVSRRQHMAAVSRRAATTATTAPARPPAAKKRAR